jgi:hypothetical protein
VTPPEQDLAEHRAVLEAARARVARDEASPEHPVDELRRIRRAVDRHVRPDAAGAPSAELRALLAAADIDVDAPTASASKVGRGVKSGIERLTSWYVRHLGVQVRDLGAAAARLAQSHSARLDELERRVDELEDR